jgi:aspartyl/glutamyl-tRNA(Asn/Gln) amidotransferase C subunit
MKPKIDMKHLSELAQLNLSSSAALMYQRDIEHILSLLDHLKTIDTSAVTQLSAHLDRFEQHRTVLREDSITSEPKWQQADPLLAGKYAVPKAIP